MQVINVSMKLGLALALALGVGDNAMAGDRFWNNNAGGSFSLATNWLNGQTLGVPGMNDSAIFDLPALYNVTFANSQSTDRVLVKHGNVTFTLGPMQYTLLNALSSTPSIAVGAETNNSASLTVRGGALSGTFTDVGQVDGAFGMLHIQGPQGSLTNALQLRVGNQGAGVMDITRGGMAVNDVAMVGAGAGSSGQMTVDGTDSFWNCLGDLTIGKGGSGMLTVSDGGEIDSQDAIIAQQLSSFGDVTVTGAESRWTIHGTLDVGMFGFGSMSVTQGASVSNEVFATVGTFPGGYPPRNGGIGAVTVSGAGSNWNIAGDLYVGYQYVGFLTINDNATVTAGNNCSIGGPTNIGALGHLTVGSGGHLIAGGGFFRHYAEPVKIQLAHHHDYIFPAISAGGFADGFPCTIELMGGFVPTIGDSFKLLSAATIVAPVTLTLPALPSTMFWHVVQTTTLVRLDVVCARAADFNHDGKVNVDDLLAVINHWGACPAPCPPSCAGDANGDCGVNVTDLLAVVNQWGDCP